MNALEFEGRPADEDHSAIPPDIACQIPGGTTVRVILGFGEGE